MKTESLDVENADGWASTEPLSLSDFTGHPSVIKLCGGLSGLRVLNLGCGEGCVAKQLLTQALGGIHRVGLSSAMVERAGRRSD